jgi:hypothetical protein
VKERRGGWFRLSAYYIARCIADLPLDIIVPFFFSVILYWMGGLRPVVFVPHLLVILLSVVVATSLGLLISAVVMELKQAQALASVLTLATMLCGGFYIQKQVMRICTCTCSTLADASALADAPALLRLAPQRARVAGLAQVALLHHARLRRPAQAAVPGVRASCAGLHAFIHSAIAR